MPPASARTSRSIPLELEAVQDSDALELPEAVVQASLGELLTDGVLQQAVHSAGLSPAGFKTFLNQLSKRIDVARREQQAGT